MKADGLDATDLQRMGMVVPDGGQPEFLPGRDLRPQDLFLYLRYLEAQHLAQLGQQE